MNKQYFKDLNSHLFTNLANSEIVKIGMWGENSQFIRLNDSKIRQTGVVQDLSYSIQLINNNRQVSCSFTLNGSSKNDKNLVEKVLEKLRSDIKNVPEDPYIVLPVCGESSIEENKGELPSFDKVSDMLLPVMQGVDLTGIWASGLIFTGVANSLGQSHWFETETYSLDYSLITVGQKMVKDCFAGTIWNQNQYEKYLHNSKKKIDLMKKDSIKVKPGTYRTYIAPAGVSDIISMLSWGGISESSLQQKDSALLKMREDSKNLSPCFTLKEDFTTGMVPRFNENGEIAQESLPLIVNGQLKNTMVSSRTEKEYGIKSNFAEGNEGLRSPSISAGDLKESEILSNIDKGLYLSNLHYLNWSDRLGGRITGMTRYACFYVENGEIIAPIENMRFDDTIYNVFGDNLKSVTDFRQLIPNIGTYGGRDMGGTYCPGILLNSFDLTL